MIYRILHRCPYCGRFDLRRWSTEYQGDGFVSPICKGADAHPMYAPYATVKAHASHPAMMDVVHVDVEPCGPAPSVT